MLLAYGCSQSHSPSPDRYCPRAEPRRAVRYFTDHGQAYASAHWDSHHDCSASPQQHCSLSPPRPHYDRDLDPWRSQPQLSYSPGSLRLDHQHYWGHDAPCHISLGMAAVTLATAAVTPAHSATLIHGITAPSHGVTRSHDTPGQATAPCWAVLSHDAMLSHGTGWSHDIPQNHVEPARAMLTDDASVHAMPSHSTLVQATPGHVIQAHALLNYNVPTWALPSLSITAWATLHPSCPAWAVPGHGAIALNHGFPHRAVLACMAPAWSVLSPMVAHQDIPGHAMLHIP